MLPIKSFPSLKLLTIHDLPKSVTSLFIGCCPSSEGNSDRSSGNPFAVAFAKASLRVQSK